MARPLFGPSLPTQFALATLDHAWVSVGAQALGIAYAAYRAADRQETGNGEATSPIARIADVIAAW